MFSLRFSALVLMLGAALWVSAAYLGEATSRQELPSRESGKTKLPAEHPRMDLSKEVLVLDPALKALEMAAESEPNNLKKRYEFADRLLESGSKTADAGKIIKSLEQYNLILKSDPKSAKALLALAQISFESGAFANSADYFSTYLKLKPEDIRARNDLALARMQNGETAKAIKIFKEINKKKKDYFESRLGLALAFKLAGKSDQAKNSAQQALQRATDAKQKEVVQVFLSTLELKPSAPDADHKQPALSSSPAQLVHQYFQTHSIIGAKLDAIKWTGPNTVNIILKEFPIHQMPPIARKTFLSKANKALKELPQEIEISLFDKSKPEQKLQFRTGG